MNTEQKAKAYDKVLEKANALYKAAEPMSGCNVILETLFPELKESEDEKVRKALIEYFNEQCDMSDWNGVYGYQVVSWLEKQGDLTIRFFTDEFELALGRIIAFWNQNHKDGKYDENELMSYIKVRETELVKLFTDNVCKVSLSDCSEEYRKAYYDGYNKCNRDWLKIKDISVDEYNKNAEILLGGQVEQKPADEDMKTLLRTEYEKGRADAIAEMQKRWSEEDELQMQAIIDLLPGLTIRHNWLKSLKGRVQPKQEWSEEDSVKLQRIIDFLWYNRKGDTDAIYQQEQDIDWLKSLRPQNKWKPSDEQMKALNYVVNLMASSESPKENDYYYNVFKDLRKQLKKLKEE